MRQHYHVLGGLHFCLSGLNYVCRTKAEAMAVLAEEKEREIDIWYQSENLPKVKIDGQVRQGYLEITNGTLEYLEITTCREPNCLLDLED